MVVRLGLAARTGPAPYKEPPVMVLFIKLPIWISKGMIGPLLTGPGPPDGHHEASKESRVSISHAQFFYNEITP